MKLLTDILFNSARNYPNRPALIMKMGYRTVTFTFAQVKEMAEKTALFFQDQGLEKGDKIIICASNSPYWVITFWAAILNGCQLVPLAVESSKEMIGKIIERVQPKLFMKSLFVKCDIENVTTHIVEMLPELVESFDSQNFSPIEISDDETAEIMFTSGTTGDPKGVMLTHANITSNVVAVSSMVHFSIKNERLLSILPLSHMFEQTIGFLFPFSIGVEIVYAHSHGAIRDLLQKYHSTKMIAVPEFLKLMRSRILSAIEEKGGLATFNKLLAFSEKIRWQPLQRLLFYRLHKKLGGKLDMIACGGAPLDQDIERFWNAVGIRIIQGYGLTETSPLTTGNTPENRKIGSVGCPIVGTSLRIADDGEIQVRGDNVFKGYFEDEEKTREAFTEDGWFKTGDMGYVDEDGFLWLKGRKKYMILGPSGQNIYPEDIETVLNEHPAVKDSCVIGLELPSGMVEVHAVLLLSDGAADSKNIVDEVNGKLEVFQKITGQTIWPEQDFPRTATKKIKKNLVTDFVQSQKNGEVVIDKIEKDPIINLLAEISGVEVAKITPETSLIGDLKFDSLMQVELVARIEEIRGVVIDERLISEKTTVDDLDEIIQKTTPLEKIPKAAAWPRSWWASLIRRNSMFFHYCLSRLFFRIKVDGLENIKDLQGPVVFMPSHVSLLDGWITFMVLPAKFRKKISFAGAHDIMYHKFWYASWLLELFFNAFSFPRRQDHHVATGLSNMGTQLDHDHSVVVFPEGHVSKDGNLQPLKRGAGLIAIEMGVPVVPIRIRDIEKLVPYDHLIPRKRGVVHVTFGKPLKFSRKDSYDDATKQIDEALRKI